MLVQQSQTEKIIDWLQNEVYLRDPIRSFEKDFANGYLFGKIFAHYQLVELKLFQKGESKRAKARNLNLTEAILYSLKVKFDVKDTEKVMDKINGAALRILWQMRGILRQYEQSNANRGRSPPTITNLNVDLVEKRIVQRARQGSSSMSPRTRLSVTQSGGEGWFPAISPRYSQTASSQRFSKIMKKNILAQSGMIQTGQMSQFELRDTGMNGPQVYNQSDYEFGMDGENDADDGTKRTHEDENHIENNEYAKLLWYTKLQNIKSFLAILQFVPCGKRQLEEILNLCSPHGNIFYNYFVRRNVEFADHHNIWKSEAFEVSKRVSGGQPVIPIFRPTFYPYETFLFKIGKETLREKMHTIESMEYQFAVTIRKLSFRFSSGLSSPPEGYYAVNKSEPEAVGKVKLNEALTIGRVEFGQTTFQLSTEENPDESNYFNLHKIAFYSNTRKMMGSVESKEAKSVNGPRSKVSNLKIKSYERIVAAKIESDRHYQPTSIQFLIVTFDADEE